MKLDRKIPYNNFWAFLFVLLLSGCNKLLEVSPENKKTADQFWQTEVQVEAATVGCYSKLQAAVKSFYVWSEVRGEITWVVPVPGKNDGLQDVNLQNISPKNQFADWSSVYSAINTLNMVIAMAPVAKENDQTFSLQHLNYYIGECKALRALCYFYLARTFLELPYITQYSATDEQNYMVKSLPANQVMDSIVSELLIAETLVRPVIEFNAWPFNTGDAYLQGAYAKGRVTKPVVDAILTDVYLTRNDYGKAINYAGSIVSDASYGFVDGNNWHTIFYPKNSYEGIFELQFIQYPYNNPGDFTKWFARAGGGIWFENNININTNTLKYWEGDDYLTPNTDDKRGNLGTYSENDRLTIWKWAGREGSIARDVNSLDANYIFYRYSDIYLMMAEAKNRMGNSDEAAQMLLKLRNNRGLMDKTLPYTSENDLEEQILDERARELAFEGKRWFDLVRIAKRQHNTLIVGKRIADFNAYPIDQNTWFQKVSDTLSWYMPIYYNELNLNKNLHQNPYYEKF